MWKKPLANSRKQQRVKLGLLALGLLISILILSKSVETISLFGQPKSSSLSVGKNSFWEQNLALNFILTSADNGAQNINLISFQPKEGRIILLKLSQEIYLEVPKGFGFWTLGSVYKLGQVENPPIGGRLLQLSTSQLLGLPIDGIIIVKGKILSPDKFLISLHQNPLSMVGLVKDVQTNLSPLQTIQLFWSLSQVRKDKIITLDLAQSSITESKLLADSSRVLGVDTVKLDYFIRQNMSDQSILEEELSVAIFNGTKIAGLAQQAARMVTNMGGNVLWTGNLEGDLEKSAVVLSREEALPADSLTVKRLSQIFAPHCLIEPCQSSDPKVTSSRAQINIILGEDYYHFWNKR